MTYPPGALAADGQLVAVAQESVVYNSVAVGGLTGVPLSCRLMGGNASGHPTSGTFAQLDIAVDGTGAAWICTAAGTPGTWVQVGSVVAGATFTGIVNLNAGTDSAGSAPVLTPTFANGTAAQLTDTTRDYEVYLQVGTPGTAFTLAIGPTSGVANAIVVSATPTATELFSVRLPAGWFLKWAGTSTTMANQLAIGC